MQSVSELYPRHKWNRQTNKFFQILQKKKLKFALYLQTNTNAYIFFNLKLCRQTEKYKSIQMYSI